MGKPDLRCAVCFAPLTPEECAVDIHGVRWDVCKGRCAHDAIVEECRGHEGVDIGGEGG